MSGFVSRGFKGRRREPEAADRLPPGQYLTRDFPVLSAGPTPHTPLDRWDFRVDGAIDQARSWTWDEFLALPRETPTVDIHCVTKWSKLDTVWEGVAIDTLLADAHHTARLPDRSLRRRLHDQSAARGRDWTARRGWRSSTMAQPLDARARRSGPAAGAASLFLEERQVGARPRARPRRSTGLLGIARLSQLW